jgi:hypothetical protein
MSAPHDWTFTVLDIAATPYAAAPELTARLRVETASVVQVHAVALRCEVQIEPQRRRYDMDDAVGLRALFGDRDRWSQTLKPFPWMQSHTTVQGFTGSTDAELALPCTYDFDITGSRFLHAVGAGTVPLALLFSGTAFVRGAEGLAVERIPWDSEARYDMPVQVWREMLESYFPRSGWIRLEHDVLSALGDYRSRLGLVSWEEAVTRLLASVDTPRTVGEQVAP